ncbi:MAG TPA: hypothetical protein VL359_02815 [bacterium]|nr:hypothetical protein [bacterium]
MRRRAATLAWAAAALGVQLMLLAAWPRPARAEYRAYELEVADVLDCRLNKRTQCNTSRLVTAMSPELYVSANGGPERTAVVLLATWMCRGDTSDFREVCPRPPARKPKFQPGEQVRVKLKHHITDGWSGKVELAYYQQSVGSNVYGVRFADRQNVYERYFEKDLEALQPAAPRSEPPK